MTPKNGRRFYRIITVNQINFFVFFYGTNVINITERNAFILIKIYSKATLSSGCQACVTIMISLNIKNIALNKI